ncbi:MAG TPA: TldD/PmbA family protein [Terriglobia bacterium]|nr:TldD/PmbA family protein [Terriglobia bacterium]
MKDLLTRALETAELRGATYADARSVETLEESIHVKNGRVEGLGVFESIGFGVRVLVNGAWGFASSADLTGAEAERVAALAVEIALASAIVPGRAVELGAPVRSQGEYTTPITIDPFSIPVEQKLDLLVRSSNIMQRNPAVTAAEGGLIAIRCRKIFVSSEGADTRQTLFETGGYIRATAVDGSEIQTRSYPNAFRYQGAAGWEYMADADLEGNAERIAEEARALLSADPCPQTTTSLILDGSQLALQIHESCGHPTELDRVFGTEAAFAGRSFLTTDKRNNFRYGSDIVNLTADSVRPTGLGTFGWDDEGVPAASSPLVRNGSFVGYLMSRETAASLGLASNGCMRADGWNRIPLIRMTNVSLEPGNWDLEALIEDTDDGVWMETNRSWSIDDMRLNFQFGTEIGYEIRKGKRGRLLKNCMYGGMTPEFWNSCDAIAGPKHWKIWGTPNCGKGEPMQTMGTGHGASPARFRNVRIGGAR